MGQAKGHFSRGGVPETPWGGKNKNLTTTLSEEGWRLVKSRAKSLKISVSEVLERWGRGYDVSFDRSQVLPAALDVSKDWKPETNQLIDRAGESLAQANEAFAELKNAIAQDQQEAQFLMEFVEGLADGKLTSADLAELSGVIDLSEEQTNRLGRIIQSFNKGDRHTNGI